jgi:hypothetical protein
MVPLVGALKPVHTNGDVADTIMDFKDMVPMSALVSPFILAYPTKFSMAIAFIEALIWLFVNETL